MKRWVLLTWLLIGFGLSSLPLAAQTPSLIICKGSSVNYKEFNEPGSLPSVAWAWTFQGGTPNTSSAREPQNISYPDTGLYLTECTSTFSDGSKSTKSVYVLVIWAAPEPIPMKDTSLCNSAVNLTLNAGNNHRGWNYHWTSTDVDLSALDTNNRTLAIQKAGTYSVKVYSKCAVTSKTITVKLGEIPKVNLGKDQFVCRNTAVRLDAGAGSGYIYSWTPTNENTQSILATTAGTYRATVTSADGCSAFDEVNLIDSCPPIVHIPNAFTPNAAAPNDVYRPYLEGFVGMEMRIYNRWGEKVFETKDLNGGWDGYYQSKEAPEGVYVCFIELMGNNGFRQIHKTDITLMR
jgi:gliding motility-associated-like protein